MCVRSSKTEVDMIILKLLAVFMSHIHQNYGKTIPDVATKV